MARGQRAGVVLVTVAVGFAVAAGAAGHTEDERLGVLVGRYHELELFDGAALVARDGVILLDRGYGLASREFGVPNGGDVRYRLASISKTFTAALVHQLVDEGRLTLDTPLVEILPEYRSDTGARVTIRHLLGHTSGIPDYFRVAGGWAAFAARMDTTRPSKPEFVASLCSGDLEFEPGSRWSYSNCGYFLLGMVIERVTGAPFEQVLRSRVLDPAGMTDSGDEGADPEAVIERLASCYVRTPEGIRRQGYWNMATAFAAGSLYATPRDLLRYDRALTGDTLLSTGAKEAMYTAGPGGYGLGWEIRDRAVGPDGAVRRIATHEGFLFGSHTRIYRVLEDGVLVVLLSNAGDAPLEDMATGLLDLLYGREPALPRSPVSNEIARVLHDGGIDAAVARYREISAKEPQRWDLGERQLNVLGYSLLREGRVEEALTILELNVETYPESGNCHDSLGEALAAAGRTTEAVRAYARSLQLDPTNRNAVERLRHLVGAS